MLHVINMIEGCDISQSGEENCDLYNRLRPVEKRKNFSNIKFVHQHDRWISFFI